MLTKTMNDHLSPKPLKIAEQFKFHKENQHACESKSVAQYLGAFRKLAEKCDFNDFLDLGVCNKYVSLQTSYRRKTCRGNCS